MNDMAELFLILLIAVFPFGQLTRLPLPRGEVNVYWLDILAAGLVFSWLGWVLKKKVKLVWPDLLQPILAFFICGLFSLFLALPYFRAREVGVASLYLWRWLVYAGVFWAVRGLVNQNKGLRSRIKNWLILTGLLSAVLGLFQYWLLPDIRFLSPLGWDPHYYRLVGSYLDPGFTGLIYVLVLMVVVDRFFNQKDKKLLLVFGLVYLALALTYSRSAYLAYLLSMAVVSFYRKAAKLFLGVLLLGAITVVVLPRPGGEGVKLARQSTIWARVNNWRQSAQIGLDFPVFGLGFNSYRYVQRDYQFISSENWRTSHAGAGADCSLLLVLATTGVVGLISYLWLLERVFKLNKAKVLVISSLVALLSHSFFNNSLFYNWAMFWFWLILAVEA